MRTPDNAGGIYNIGDSVTYFVHDIVGGNGIYQQTKWWAVAGNGFVADTDSGASTPYNDAQYVYTYSSPVNLPQARVIVRDTAGNQGVILCGPVYITNPANDLTLGIGGDENGAKLNTSDDNTKTSGTIKVAEYRIKQGGKFALYWNNQFSTADLCKSSSPIDFSVDKWNSSTVLPGEDYFPFDGSVTKNEPTGTYVFNIQCKKSDGHGGYLSTVVANKTVKLIITSSSEGER
jgi:hypothetical protein